MIHIGTVHLNGREYRLELNRSENSEKDVTGTDAARRAPRRLPPGRSEVVPFKPNRRITTGHSRLSRSAQSLEELRRITALTGREQVRAVPLLSRWKTDRDRVVKAVCRFLSWCFPVREFRSPFQRVLYLSIERPKPKNHRRALLP